MRNGSLDGPSMAVTRKETQSIVIQARNHIELALSAIGHREWHSIGVFGPIRLSIKVHRPTHNRFVDGQPFRRQNPRHTCAFTGGLRRESRAVSPMIGSATVGWIARRRVGSLLWMGTVAVMHRECEPQDAASTTCYLGHLV